MIIRNRKICRVFDLLRCKAGKCLQSLSPVKAPDPYVVGLHSTFSGYFQLSRGLFPKPNTTDMIELLNIKIDSGGNVSFVSHYNPLRGINLYQDTFVSLLFETDKIRVRRWMEAIRILGLAELCAAKKPQLSMAMFKKAAAELAPVREKILQNFGGELNFNCAKA